MCPVTAKAKKNAALIFINNNDLLHINLEREETVHEVFAAIQDSVSNWGKHLIAPGGSLKQRKCFYHLISFGWPKDSSWGYHDQILDSFFALTIPLPNDRTAPIKHK